MSKGRLLRFVLTLYACLPFGMSWAANINTHTSTKSNPKKVSETPRTRRRIHHLAKSRTTNLTRVSATTHRRRRYYERFTASSFPDQIGQFRKLSLTVFRPLPRFWDAPQSIVCYASPDYAS